VPEGVLDPAKAPAVGVLHLRGEPRSERDGMLDDRVRVVDDEQDPDAAPAERLRARVPVRGRFVVDPEGRVADRELRDNGLVRVGTTYAMELRRSEGSLVELDGGTPPSDGQLWCDSDLSRLHARIMPDGSETAAADRLAQLGPLDALPAPRAGGRQDARPHEKRAKQR